MKNAAFLLTVFVTGIVAAEIARIVYEREARPPDRSAAAAPADVSGPSEFLRMLADDSSPETAPSSEVAPSPEGLAAPDVALPPETVPSAPQPAPRTGEKKDDEVYIGKRTVMRLPYPDCTYRGTYPCGANCNPSRLSITFPDRYAPQRGQAPRIEAVTYGGPHAEEEEVSLEDVVSERETYLREHAKFNYGYVEKTGDGHGLVYFPGPEERGAPKFFRFVREPGGRVIEIRPGVADAAVVSFRPRPFEVDDLPSEAIARIEESLRSVRTVPTPRRIWMARRQARDKGYMPRSEDDERASSQREPSRDRPSSLPPGRPRGPGRVPSHGPDA